MASRSAMIWRLVNLGIFPSASTLRHHCVTELGRIGWYLGAAQISVSSLSTQAKQGFRGQAIDFT
jgi:hypothetical protein